MFWMDYAIHSLGEKGRGFRIEGDWPGEVMGMPDPKEPTKQKDHWLYKPGDVFIVDDEGWLRKSDQLSAMIIKYEKSKVDNT